MKGAFSKVLIFLSVAGVLVVGALAGLYLNRIMLAEKLVDHLVMRQDLPPINLRIDELTPWRLEVYNVAWGRAVFIKALKAEFHPLALLSGEINLIDVQGLTLDVSHYEGGLLDQLTRRSQAGPADTSAQKSPLARISEIRVKGGSIRYQDARGHARAAFQVGTDRQTIHLSLLGEGHYEGFRVKDLTVEGQLPKSLDHIDLHILKGHLENPQQDLFKPVLGLSGTAKLNAQNAEGNFRLKDAKNRFAIDLKGTANVADKALLLDVTLPPVSLARTGLQLEDLSPLADIGYGFDATMSAAARLTLKPEIVQTKGQLELLSSRFPLSDQLVQQIGAKGVIDFDYDLKTKQLKVSSDTLVLEDQHQPKRLHNMSAHLLLHANAKDITGQVGLMLQDKPNVRLLSAEMTHDIETQKGHAVLQTPSLDWGEHLSPANVSPILKEGVTFKGSNQATSTLGWDKGNLQGDLNIRFSDFSVSSDLINIENLNTDLTFPSLLPPNSAGIQRLTFDTIESFLTLHNPVLDFSLEPKRAKLHQFHAGFLGGRLSLAKTVLDPLAAGHRATVHLKELRLGDFFNLIGIDGLSGTGALSGDIPLHFVAGDVEINAAKLDSEGPGTLKLQSNFAKDMLGSAGEEMVLVLDVLSNFHYQSLSLTLNRPLHQNAVLTLGLEGHNPDVKDGYPFRLNINLETNLDRILETVREGYRLSKQALRYTIGLH